MSLSDHAAVLLQLHDKQHSWYLGWLQNINTTYVSTINNSISTNF